MVSIRIYIEGAGNANDDDELLPMQRPGFRSKIIADRNTSSLREGFSKFFQELVDIAKEQKIEFRIVMCGSRADAYENFKLSLESNPESFNILLIDSESPISPDQNSWEHLRNRKEDQSWIRGDNLDYDDDQCHFMVQAMESWFVADIDALKGFYGEEFKEEKIIRGMGNYQNIEQVSPKTLLVWLESATRHSKHGKYDKKTRRPPHHALEILKRLNADIVRQSSPYCDRLFNTLRSRIRYLLDES
ncbi:DUF4276 family protein [Aphanizomenon sp. CS-733/32]|uniref:DUF4276 family protein n=1 Tax=Aphanizomenon sp. CS-733/32 TaxID=3021715 RepID=UPI00232F7171|nr:DUF4276 family protein [Aphanizomenon sp. CS-733/32]MDB9310587.1 DUF4276 family protein [Aphanizomenon sp. CS-733/32]